MLYKVTTNRYKEYYVEAKTFDEAKYKVEKYIIENDDNTLFDEDGSLMSNFKVTDVVKEIRLLSDEYIK